MAIKKVGIVKIDDDVEIGANSTIDSGTVAPTEIGSGMGEWFDENIGKLAFRLEFKKDKNGTERIVWHGMEDGKPIVFDTDPYTGFWQRF